MVLVEVGVDGEPKSVTCSQHNAGEARRWDLWLKRDGRPLVCGPFSHAKLLRARNALYFPGADHLTTQPCRVPELQEFGPWQSWRGAGALRSAHSRPPQHRGTSPAAPIAQAERWPAPLGYHAKAVPKAGGVVLSGALVPRQGDLPMQPEPRRHCTTGRR
jgi:hypothetical protein